MGLKKKEVAPKDAPGKMTWHEAMEYAESLGDGWRLPTRVELLQLYQLRDYIGGFASDDTYWSSSQASITSAWRQSFSNGDQASIGKDVSKGVRVVRDIEEVENGNEI